MDTWRQKPGSAIHFRAYETYDDYLGHQRQKLDDALRGGGFFASNSQVAAYRRHFYRRFSRLVLLLPREARILCAGARQGTEVEVLRDLGFSNAYGVDLNPGPDNRLVRIGDFNALDEADRSLDLIYSNSVDHAFDIDRFFAEHARALKSDGYVMYDLPLGPAFGPWEAVGWKHEDSVLEVLMRYFDRVVRVQIDGRWKWILMRGVRQRD